MNRQEVKDKLRNIIIELLLVDSETNEEVPESIRNYFLEKYSFTNSQKHYSEDLSSFILRLNKYVEDKHLMNDLSAKAEIEDEFINLEIGKLLDSELENNEISWELVKALEEIIKMKDKHSEYFKDKCKAQETSIDVMYQKCMFLQKQLFLKHYGEENALEAHLVLRNMLRQELDSLRKQYDEEVELNEKYEEIKNNGQFQELFRKYKELRKIEGVTEIWREVL